MNFLCLSTCVMLQTSKFYLFLWICFGGLRFISSWPRLNNVERWGFFKKKLMHKCDVNVKILRVGIIYIFSSYMQFNTFILFPIF